MCDSWNLPMFLFEGLVIYSDENCFFNVSGNTVVLPTQILKLSRDTSWLIIYPSTSVLVYYSTFLDTPNEYQEDIDDFENGDHENHTQLRDLTHEVDYLWHKVEANESRPTEAISHLECELNRLILTLCPSAPPEPLDKVLQQYMQTLFTAQKKISFVNTLLQHITIFKGNYSSQ